MAEKSLLLKLFTTFFKIGAFTFGGGWAMISIIEREIVDKHRWIDKTEFLDLLAVAQSMPGILAVNISVVIGDKLRSLKGSLAAASGTIMPSFLIILLIAMFLTPDLITGNPVISSIFKGIRPAVVALIVAPVITSAKSAGLYLEDRMDSCRCRTAHLVEDTISLKPYTLHRRRRSNRLGHNDAQHQKRPKNI